MLPGVRPSISLASLPTASTFLGPCDRRLHGDDARLVRDDAAALDERQRRGRPEVDGQVVGKHSVDPIEEHGVSVRRRAVARAASRADGALDGRTNPKSLAELSREIRSAQDNLGRARIGLSDPLCERVHVVPRSGGLRVVEPTRGTPCSNPCAAQGASDLHLFDLRPVDRDLRDQLRPGRKRGDEGGCTGTGERRRHRRRQRREPDRVSTSPTRSRTTAVRASSARTSRSRC